MSKGGNKSAENRKTLDGRDAGRKRRVERRRKHLIENTEKGEKRREERR